MRLNSKEVDEIIDFYRKASFQELCKEADRRTRKIFGDKVYLRGLIEFSSFCARNCHYCGLRADNQKAARYRLEPSQILQVVKKGYEHGFKTFVLQSGEDFYYGADMLVDLMRNIKKSTAPDTAITLSCGIRPKEEYIRLKEGGANRYLMRFEISDPDLHQRIRGGISLDARLAAINDLREAGFEVGSGYMVGLPWESEEMRINNALLAHKLDLHMVGVGPFIPHPETPLGNQPLAKPQERLIMAARATALLRLLLPYANIPATTAAGTIDDKGRELMMEAGANVLMPNIGPVEHKADYLLYPDKICLAEDGFETLADLEKRVQSVGKNIDYSRGDSPAFLGRV